MLSCVVEWEKAKDARKKIRAQIQREYPQTVISDASKASSFCVKHRSNPSGCTRENCLNFPHPQALYFSQNHGDFQLSPLWEQPEFQVWAILHRQDHEAFIAHALSKPALPLVDEWKAANKKVADLFQNCIKNLEVSKSTLSHSPLSAHVSPHPLLAVNSDSLGVCFLINFYVFV
jgi:hypothetical protein